MMEPKDTTRVVFMGSPEFAVPSLRLLAAHYTVAGVVTQPDRPAGRGRCLTAPPVKLLAQELGLSIIQPQKLRQPEAMGQIQDWAPDLIVVTAFGQILRPELLDLPAHGCVNVHASLLPRWRGAAPINAALLHGDEQTGVTIMRMDAGVDTGPLINQRQIAIQPAETAVSLSGRLAKLGAELLIETLPAYLKSELTLVSQDEGRATYAPMLKKEDGELDFSSSAVELERKVRALLRARPQLDPAIEASLSAGEHTIYQGLPAICTGQGLLILEELLPAGKKPMPGKTFLQGARNWH
jgi:methionyl-tRNA formyltransferase